MNKTEFMEWGMDFVSTLDEEFQEPGNEDLLVYWQEGDVDQLLPYIRERHPDVTDEQLVWLHDFLSEL